MGQAAVAPLVTNSLKRFARLLVERIGAEHVLLFGSYARGEARADSDVDVIIVSNRFRDIPLMSRAIGLRPIWYEAGGDTSMDLFCLTPEEFTDAQARIGIIAAVIPEAIDLLAA